MKKVLGLFSIMFISMVLVACQSPSASEPPTNKLDEEAYDEQLETNGNEGTETEGTELTEEAESESVIAKSSEEDTVSDNEPTNGVNLTVDTIHFDEEFITVDVTLLMDITIHRIYLTETEKESF
ncbi:hypothetical protein AJ85_10495 [Alkalihalobacillus alcalophilus ATCC 27647 = CGMCC 1.3604]|uniref:Uncharacterized protein n=1 Tax=Alkalihalobacillus alcalophilus ATCC 27647 = CGMCC 1.3604 TaxID=1218173 RepID=A0A094XI12_ALKAL|nr:hypothetical protein [Alkalihalobacillus alcalophilus]KGA98420.1 hypothetical protein BALCAV_0204955 [Alkalihalobacillus alcalophilus ATCC 27647 = CGMCC 1.3604]MED1563703.1 hypothetical protein [Alkalihalobacillus alcalophilus]THG90480.1 hypothetical protein AJ85_10495 [Alkalihalobacillus alcalophilus ATCC 27647 = CGMCC 1.3604]